MALMLATNTMANRIVAKKLFDSLAMSSESMPAARKRLLAGFKVNDSL